MLNIDTLSVSDTPMTGYKAVQLPKNLVDQIDEFLEKQNLGYTSRSEIVKDAVRGFLAKLKRIETSPP